MSHGAMNLKFTEARLAQVLVGPIVSENGTSVGEKHNQVLFKVLRDATKPEIKAAVELLFKVEVKSVRVANQKGKTKRFGGRIFPNRPDENFTQKINKKMYRAGMAAILSQLARDGRLAVVDSITVDSPKTKALAAKFKAMGLDSVLVIADTVDENLALASRNLANVLVIEPRYADPLSLVFYKKVLVTKGAIEQLKEMFA